MNEKQLCFRPYSTVCVLAKGHEGACSPPPDAAHAEVMRALVDEIDGALSDSAISPMHPLNVAHNTDLLRRCLSLLKGEQ